MAKQNAAVADAPETETPAQPDKKVSVVIKEMFEGGMSRSDIAKELGITYQRVFQVTKGQTNAATASSAQGRRVILESGEPRVDYIRRRFAEGATRGEIAKELGITYQIVFQATKVKDTDADEGDEGSDEELDEELEPADETDAEEADEPEAE